MKKMIFCALVAFLLAVLAPGGFAMDDRDMGKIMDLRDEDTLARKLEELGLFRGFGDNGDMGSDFGLNQRATRVQALVMLVRILGKDTEAEEHSGTHPFTDVPAWADGYVSYAYEAGLVRGVSDTLFGADDTVTAEMYLTMMLRALGYKDRNYVYGDWEGYGSAEFSWDSPWALASYTGILPMQVDKTDFLRNDMVDVTAAALYARIKGSSVLLKDKLINEGVFTEEQFDAVFPEDPFEEYRLIDSRVSAAIDEKVELGKLEYDRYVTECHIIVDMYREDGAIVVKPMVFIYNANINEDNTLGSDGGGAAPWLIKLDAGTYEILECKTAGELAEMGLSWEDILPGMAGYAAYLGKGMDRVCRMEALILLDSGVIAYRQPTYEESLKRYTSYFDYTDGTIETEFCTVLTGRRGTPHGSDSFIFLVYKPGSSKGEGQVVSLPMPEESYWHITSLPDKLWLDENGHMLHYSYHYDDALIFEEGTESEYVAHKAGTYHYTTDLITGETSLVILEE